MRRFPAVVFLFSLTMMISGCLTYFYETRFNEQFLGNSKPGSPVKSIKIPADIAQNHLENLWEMFWESENTIYLVMRDKLDQRGQSVVYSKPDYGVYLVDLEKGETVRLSDAEREDFLFRMKNRFKYYETEPEKMLDKIGKFTGTLGYFMGDKKAKHKRLFEGQIRYGDVSIDASFEYIQQEYERSVLNMKIRNNLTNKTQALSACNVTEYDFRKTQISPDGSYYFLCGRELVKTDENTAKPVFIVNKIEGKGYEDKIKGRQFIHKYGDDFYTQFNAWNAQFSPKWDKIAVLAFHSYDKTNYGFRIEIYPADFYLKKQESVK